MNDLVIKWEKTAEYFNREHFINAPLYKCDFDIDSKILACNLNITSTIVIDTLGDIYKIYINIEDYIDDYVYCMNLYTFSSKNYDMVSIMIEAHILICNLIEQCLADNL